MIAQNQKKLGAHSIRACDAPQAKMYVPPWWAKAGQTMAKVAVVGTVMVPIIFGNLLGEKMPSRQPEHGKTPAFMVMAEKVMKSFRATVAWAQEMTLEEALALLKSPVETQKAGAYSLPASSYTSVLSEAQKQKLKELQKEGKNLYLGTEPFAMGYKGIDVAFGVNWETKLVIGIGKNDSQFVDLTAVKNFRDYFRGKSVDPETLSKLSRYTKVVGFVADEKGSPGILIADKGDENILLLKVEITAKELVVSGTTIALGFKLSDKFDMRVVTAKGTDYSLIVLYDSAKGAGVIFPADSKPLPPIVIWAEKGTSPEFEQVGAVPVKQDGKTLIAMYIGNEVAVMEYMRDQDAMQTLYDGKYLAMK